MLLEPIEAEKPFDAKAFWAKIDALRGDEPFPEVTDDDLHPERDDTVEFD